MENKITIYHYRVINVNDRLEIQVKPLTGIIKSSSYNNERLYYTLLNDKFRSYINADKLDTLLSSTLSMYSLSPDKTKWFIDRCYCDKFYKLTKLKEEYFKLNNLVNGLLVLANKNKRRDT